jgi:predicted ribosomally synthesized peptide with SipW-like signal peptide
MLRIVKSLAVILAVATIATSATHAYFTSDVTVPGMTFATGTLSITDTSEGWMLPVVFTNLKPGDTIRKWVKLQNTGSLDVSSLTVQAVHESDSSPSLLSQIKVSLIGQVNGFDGAYYTPDWTGGATIDPFLTGSATNILGSYFYSGGTPAHVMVPGTTDTVILDFTVPTTLDNTYQGKSASFDLQFHAEQAH